jgi:APA family basic amino acid/polyamine antiporter
MSLQEAAKGSVPGALTPHASLPKQMGLFSATCIVMGSMVGSGIYIVSADIGRYVDSPALLIGAWLVTMVMTVIGALSYAELAAMMPKAGGQYVYLREALGPLWGFLYGWTLLLVIQTGTIAAVAVSFGKFLGVFFPAISASHWILHLGHVPVLHIGAISIGNLDVGINRQNLCAIAVIAVVTGINVLGVRLGSIVQNIFTSAKIVALATIILAGLLIGGTSAAHAANFGPGLRAFWHNAGAHVLHPLQGGMDGQTHWVGLFVILAVVQVGSLFSADAWNNITFTAGEVKHPSRNLPLSLVLGVCSVLFLYILVNFAYLNVLPLHGDPSGATALQRGIQYATEDRVATAVMEQTLGHIGAFLMAVAVLISTFGCANGMSLAGARVVLAMSEDGLFFRSAARIHRRFGTPAVALVIQGLWTAILCISGSYGQLLDYTIFAALLFYILTIGSLFVLRRKLPHAHRPYRALGYPVLPALYLVMACWISVVLLMYKPQYTWPGVAIVLLGVPVYFLWSKLARPVAA